MRKLVVLFVIITFFTAGCSKSKILYYEKYGEIFEYNFEDDTSQPFLRSLGKGVWNYRSDENNCYFAVVEENFNVDIPEADILLYDSTDKQLIKRIGKNGEFDYNGQIFEGNVIYVKEIQDTSIIMIHNIENGMEIELSDRNGKSIYPILDKKNRKILYQNYDSANSKWKIMEYDFSTQNTREIKVNNREVQYPVLSEDGKLIAFEETEIDKSYIGVYDVVSDNYSRLTDTGEERFPVFIGEKTLIYVKSGNLYSNELYGRNEIKLSNFHNDETVSNPKYCGSDYVIFDLLSGESTYIYMINLKTKMIKKIDIGKGSFIKK